MAGPVEPQRHTLSAADQLPQLGLSAAFVVLVRDDEPVLSRPLSFPSPCSAGSSSTPRSWTTWLAARLKVLTRSGCRGLTALPFEEQADRFVDAPLTGFGSLGRVDIVDVVPLKAVGQVMEEPVRPLVRLQSGCEVRRHLYYPRGVRNSESDANQVTSRETRCRTVGGAETDHVRAAHDGHSASVCVAIDINHDWRTPARPQSLDNILRHHDSGVVPTSGERCIELLTLRPR